MHCMGNEHLEVRCEMRKRKGELRVIRKLSYFMKHRLNRNNHRKIHGKPMLRRVQIRKARRLRRKR